MENCFVVARQTKTKTGFSYKIETKKHNTYTLYIKGELNAGEYAKIIFESNTGYAMNIGDYKFKLNENKEHKISIVGNGSPIVFSLIFNNNLFNNFFIEYCIILNDRNIVTNSANLKLMAQTTIKHAKNTGIINTYERIKNIKNKNFIIIDDKNINHIRNLFEGYYKIVIIRSGDKMISCDNKNFIINMPESYKNLFFDLIEGDGYYIKS